MVGAREASSSSGRSVANEERIKATKLARMLLWQAEFIATKLWVNEHVLPNKGQLTILRFFVVHFFVTG
jgi:hypothetical protein